MPAESVPSTTQTIHPQREKVWTMPPRELFTHTAKKSSPPQPANNPTGGQQGPTLPPPSPPPSPKAMPTGGGQPCPKDAGQPVEWHGKPKGPEFTGHRPKPWVPGQFSAAASGNFVPAGPPKAAPSEADDFQSCVDPSEGGTGRSKAWNAWQDRSWDDDESGQHWSQPVDWRLHRQWGYNAGGIQSRARRGLKRIMLQEMRKLREKLGVPQNNMTLSEEAGLFESPTDMAEVLHNLSIYRVGLEVAHLSAAVETANMAGVEKALPASNPPWKPAGPNCPTVISGQDRPRVPTLVPQSFSPPPKATGQPCPAPPPPPPPPPLPPCPAVPPPLWFSEPKGLQLCPKPAGPLPHPHGQSSSSSTVIPMFKLPPPGSPPPPRS